MEVYEREEDGRLGDFIEAQDSELPSAQIRLRWMDNQEASDWEPALDNFIRRLDLDEPAP